MHAVVMAKVGQLSPCRCPVVEMAGFAWQGSLKPVVEMAGFASLKYRPTVSRLSQAHVLFAVTH